MEALRDILGGLLARVRTDLDGDIAAALAWTLAAGPSLACRARCLGLHEGTLRLGIESNDVAATRQQLESVARELRQELNRLLGPNAVRRLIFS